MDENPGDMRIIKILHSLLFKTEIRVKTRCCIRLQGPEIPDSHAFFYYIYGGF